MARLVLLSLFSSLLLAMTITKCKAFSKTTNSPFPMQNPEKLTHLHFYLHDYVSGDKQTAVVVASGPNTNSSLFGFGAVSVVDDPLTVGPLITTEEVGRAQGIYASADQNTFGLLVAFNFVFTKGEFSGSTIAMYGRNPALMPVREMPIIGGTGAFRFGRGFALAKTHLLTREVAVVEYNVFIWH